MQPSVAVSGVDAAADDVPAHDEQTGPGRPGREGLRERAGREVRHVAVLKLRLHGVDELVQAAGASQASRVLDQLRSTLAEAAFRRGAHLVWEPARSVADGALSTSLSARAVVGLIANPSRAPSTPFGSPSTCTK
ncbi:MAG: hypothetical protein QM756_21045 [Polyangiaceae bacterium]